MSNFILYLHWHALYAVLTTTIIILVIYVLFRKKYHNELVKQKKELESDKHELIKSKKALESSIITKDKLLSIIAHDIRGPFNSLMGFSEILSHQINNYDIDQIKNFAGIIHESSRNLYFLFENLLQWSRATNDSSKFESEAIDIKVLALSTISLYEVSAYKKEIEIECNINKPLYAWANKNLLSTVLRNLIDNAIKFTFPLGIITVNAIETSNEIVIEVADSGKGITDNEKEKLFNIQSNTSTPGTLNEKGTGLGLVLCKEFVEINGGKIWVIDNPNKGSIFKFTIPKYINLIPNSHDTEKSTS